MSTLTSAVPITPILFPAKIHSPLLVSQYLQGEDPPHRVVPLSLWIVTFLDQWAQCLYPYKQLSFLVPASFL